MMRSVCQQPVVKFFRLNSSNQDTLGDMLILLVPISHELIILFFNSSVMNTTAGFIEMNVVNH